MVVGSCRLSSAAFNVYERKGCPANGPSLNVSVMLSARVPSNTSGLFSKLYLYHVERVYLECVFRVYRGCLEGVFRVCIEGV